MDISYGIAKGSTNRPCGALPNPCVLLGVLDHDGPNGLAQLRGRRRQGRQEGIEKNVTFLRRMVERNYQLSINSNCWNLMFFEETNSIITRKKEINYV